jgi:hypothetical protein
LQGLQGLLNACWTAFDLATQAAYGKELRKGPHGGGRDLVEVVRHVQAAEASYLTRLGGRLPNKAEQGANRTNTANMARRNPGRLLLEHQEVIDRRQVILDHVWEIEDRIL